MFTYQQINATPTPLLAINRPDTFTLLLQERPASRLSCVLLIAPKHYITGSENPNSDLSCVLLVAPKHYITGSENPTSDLSCVLLIAPQRDISISENPTSDLSCRLLKTWQLVVSGTVNPDCTGQYFKTGVYGGKNLYSQFGGPYYIWWATAYSEWFINMNIGGFIYPGWHRINANVVGLYSPGGGPTGNATVTAV
jgi:hypothetical protein